MTTEAETGPWQTILLLCTSSGRVMMRSGAGTGTGEAKSVSGPWREPHLLVELEPRGRTFLRNLLDLLLGRNRAKADFACLDLDTPLGTFWTDVFVTARLPWRGWAESLLCHGIALAALWSLPRLLPPPIQTMPLPVFDSASVIYYSKEEYLPPLDTGAQASRPREAPKGEPEYSRQPIISVPPDPDNSRQTIVTPPKVKLEHDVEIPNIVAWTPSNVPVPMAATARSASELQMPALPVEVVAPAPQVARGSELKLPSLDSPVVAPAPQVKAAAVRSVQGPKPAVIEPPPNVEAASAPRLGDINVGPSQVIAPAPQLALAEQRSIPEPIKAGVASAAAVVPPPPLLAAGVASPLPGRLIALSLRPAAMRQPTEPPGGNRRGEFAATPEGKPGAPATPDLPAVATGKTASGISNAKLGSGGDNATGIPPGLFVGAGPAHAATSNASVSGALPTQDMKTQHAVDPKLLANVTYPRVVPPRRNATPVDDIHATDLEKKVFGPRRFYSMTLNMPNLNSMGGSWVIRFAELKEDGDQGDLVPPVATQKIDPAYPAELMRTRIEGTITLYAVIHSDGSVGDVRVLAGDDDRLIRFASSALTRWRFRPATKNGNAVALEAVVTIPFRAGERQ